MPILTVHQGPSLTRERYEQVVRRLTNGRSRLESLSDVPVDGLLVHVAGETKDGFLIIDVWESEEAVDRFTARSAADRRGAGDRRPAAALSGPHPHLGVGHAERAACPTA
jgi:hypothetical protein